MVLDPGAKPVLWWCLARARRQCSSGLLFCPVVRTQGTRMKNPPPGATGRI